MTTDAITIVNLMLTAIGAVAACIAAYFSWKAPSKTDLARVEQHTADTSQHLRKQTHREELAAKAQAVPIVVTGESHPSELLRLLLTLDENSAPLTLTRVGLYNEHGSLFGTVECVETSYAHQYEAEIPPQIFKDWFQQRRSISGQSERLRLRVYMVIDGHEAFREIPVNAYRGSITRGSISMHVNRVEGEV